MEDLSGNVQGLSAAHKRLLERIWRRRVDPRDLISSELASFLCECARETGRQIGIMIDRRGTVTHVIVGNHERLLIPDLGPRRAGAGRMRGLRLIHTHLRGEALTHDDLTDLAKLRLDAVAAIQMRDGQLGPIDVAHLLPPNAQDEQWRRLTPISVHALQHNRGLDFVEVIRALEEEFAAQAGGRTVDDGKDRAVLVQILTPGRGRAEATQRNPHGDHDISHDAPTEAEARLHELKELCRTAGVTVTDVIVQKRAQVDPKYLIGKGKLEELVLRSLHQDATLLIFDGDLSPAQARAITDLAEIKVIDRTMLILDIFAQHAHSRDGKLQVELAQLKYTLPRLGEKNTMMSRLTGGIGGRGPGETKLEINRRRAKERVHLLEEQIDKLGMRRGQRRALRTRSAVPVVSIVGYTNAGKSTLLNTLTKGDVLAENKLFATLDPTSRRLRFPSEREIVMTDTVGFIRDLPDDLVNAFRSTLEELAEADLLLHVVDAADPSHSAHIRAVEKILDELDLKDKPRLLVFNKADCLSAEQILAIDERWREEGRRPILVSARAEDTTRPLLEEMEQRLWAQDKVAERERRSRHRRSAAVEADGEAHLVDDEAEIS